MAVSKINTNSLGLTIASGTGTQDPTANNTVYDLVTGLTIPDNALIVIGFDFAANSGENGDPGSDATCWIILTNSSNTAIDSTLASNMINANPKVGYRDVTNSISYLNETGSALTSHKIRAQQYADGDFNSSLVTIKYKIITLSG
mgnify:CR=1 FL=1